MYPIIAKLGGRKFLLILLGCFIFTLLLCAGKIDQSAYQVLVLAFAGSYLASNHFEKKAAE